MKGFNFIRKPNVLVSLIIFAAGTSLCLDAFHSFFNGWLYEECSLLEFFQDSRTFVFLLKSFKSFIDGFVFADNNAYQAITFLFGNLNGFIK